MVHLYSVRQLVRCAHIWFSSVRGAQGCVVGQTTCHHGRAPERFQKWYGSGQNRADGVWGKGTRPPPHQLEGLGSTGKPSRNWIWYILLLVKKSGIWW